MVTASRRCDFGLLVSVSMPSPCSSQSLGIVTLTLGRGETRVLWTDGLWEETTYVKRFRIQCTDDFEQLTIFALNCFGLRRKSSACIPPLGLDVDVNSDVNSTAMLDLLTKLLHPPRWTDKILCRFFGAPAKPRAALGSSLIT